MPEVSIILPFKDAEDTIDECLDSILRQTLDDFEAIAIADGSTDSSADRILSRSDPRIRLIRSGGEGIVAALNLGIARARSGRIARMDADDRMHSDRLRLQNRYLDDRPDLALVACQVRLFGNEPVRNGYREYVRWQNAVIEPEDVAADIYVESPFAHPSVMMRREAVEAAGGYRDGPFPEDYDLWLRMHAAGRRMSKVPQILLDWRDRTDRLSRTDPRYSREAFDRLRARRLARDPRLKGRALAIWGAGRRTRQRARHLLEQGVAPCAWIDIDPRKIGRLVGGVPVRAPTWLEGLRVRPYVLIYIARHGAREEVEAFLESAGYEKSTDHMAVG